MTASYSLPAPLVDGINEIARAQRRKKSSVAADAFSEYLKRESKKAARPGGKK